MFCSEYEMTECGTKLCCHDCDNEKCEKDAQSKSRM